MNIGELCTREVYILDPRESVLAAAAEMRKRHVGALLVVNHQDGLTRPIGILTDRDIVNSLVARGDGISRLTVGEAMTPDPMTVAESASIIDAIGSMRGRAVRRAPVVNEAGGLVGIVSFDDLFCFVAEELGGLARLIESQPQRERAQLPVSSSLGRARAERDLR